MLKLIFRMLLVATPLCLALLGCTSEIITFVVEGSVTFKGKAIPKGEIYFDPDPAIKGIQGKGLIRDGKFSTKGFNSVIVAGKYIVRIYGFDGKPREEAPLGKALFPPYEISLTLVEGQPVVIEVPSK